MNDESLLENPSIEPLGTHSLATRSCFVDYLHTHEAYDIDKTLGEDVLVVNLKYAVTNVAIDSDVLQALHTPENCSVFMPAGTRVKEKADAHVGSAFYISFARGFLESESRRAFNDQFGELRCLTDLIDPVAGNLAGEMRRFFLSNEVGGSAYLEYLTSALALRLMANLIGRQPEMGRNSEKLSTAQLAQIREYIEAHLDEELGLSDLTTMVDIQQTRFVKCFRNSVGTTPYQYIMQRRIERAQRLLEKSDSPLADIAYICGFSSQQHMTQMFTRRLGITPSRYRKEMN